jgi:ABC-type transport system substrate-binding protein
MEVEIMRIRRVASTFAAAALLAVASTPASATASPASDPGAVITLSWNAPQASNQWFTTTITCDPAGGGEDWYLDAEAACADLTVANGDFNALPGRGLNCTGTGQYWAIRTTATGTWHGTPVNYDETHLDWCYARRKLGVNLF